MESKPPPRWRRRPAGPAGAAAPLASLAASQACRHSHTAPVALGWLIEEFPPMRTRDIADMVFAYSQNISIIRGLGPMGPTAPSHLNGPNERYGGGRWGWGVKKEISEAQSRWSPRAPSQAPKVPSQAPDWPLAGGWLSAGLDTMGSCAPCLALRVAVSCSLGCPLSPDLEGGPWQHTP